MRFKKPVIRANTGFDDDVVKLLCPVCGEDNLHQGVVTMYDLPSEARAVPLLGSTVVRASCIDANAPDFKGGGLTIAFWCEHCQDTQSPTDEQYELVIAQHKGTTYLHWRAALKR